VFLFVSIHHVSYDAVSSGNGGEINRPSSSKSDSVLMTASRTFCGASVKLALIVAAISSTE
jgi:hypothetical protein